MLLVAVFGVVQFAECHQMHVLSVFCQTHLIPCKTAVTERGDILADEEVAVAPFHIVFAAPLGEVFVDELSIPP